MSNAVRALDPTGPTPADGVPPPPEDAGRRPQWLAAIVGGLAAVVAIVTIIQPSSPPPPPPLEPIEPIAPAALSRGSYPAPAIEEFESFITLIDQGDGSEALSLMVDELPDVLGVGTAEYPQLPSDAGWWTDGRLNRDNVGQFARYVHAVPGSVSLTDCRDFADGPRVVVVSCAYTSTGGALAALGLDREDGRLFGIMIDERVAGLIRDGADQREVRLWHHLAEWAAINRPEAQLRTPILGGAGWKLELDYSSASASEHQALAHELAASTLGRARLRY
jgi:hypothetical protein